MPRGISGTYTLPSGNPVVTGTEIETTWGNDTMNDIATALTGSLSRSGDGGMLAPLKLQDGTSGAPGLSWLTQTTAGWYRAGTSDFRFAIAGVDRLKITATTNSVYDGAALQEIGYRNLILERQFSADDDTSATDNGKMLEYTGAGGDTFTLDSDLPANGIVTIINSGSGALSIAASGTLSLYDGTGSIGTGTRTLAIGGVCSISSAGSGDGRIWGNGGLT